MPNLGNTFDSTGRLQKLTDLTASSDIISNAAYGAAGQLLTMTGASGAPNETRTYNSIGQMTRLQSGSLDIQYAYPATQNNGKISSQYDSVSGEQITYTYDSLNRLASATGAATEVFRDRDVATQRQEVVIDLQSRSPRERLGPQIRFFCAVGNEMLLGTEFVQGNEPLILADLSDFLEVKRVPLRVKQEAYRDRTDLFFSDDRKVFVYALDRKVVCRRSEDLEILWTRTTEPDPLKAVRLAVSADGGRVAAALIDDWLVNNQRHLYVDIYDGRHGTPISRLPIDGQNDVALTPDGSLLAGGGRAKDRRSNDLLLRIDLYSIPSGEVLASQLHDRVPPGRFQNLNGSFSRPGLRFTADGKFLISSAFRSTKLWERETIEAG